jgi:hypothetical protein
MITAKEPADKKIQRVPAISNDGIRGPGDHSLLGIITEPAPYTAVMLSSNNTKEDTTPRTEPMGNIPTMEIGGPDIVWRLG